MEKRFCETLRTAATLTVASSCGALSTGRCISAFYAQTGAFAWIGVCAACIVYGCVVGGTMHLKRKTEVHSLAEMYIGTFGGKIGAVFTALHAVFFAFAGVALLRTAADTAALALPLHYAERIGTLFALAAALWLSRRKARFITNVGSAYFAVLIAMMLALIAFAKAPSKDALNFYVSLRLENNICAAVLLGAIHAALAGGMCASAAIRLYPIHARPCFAAFLSAMAFATVLLCGNAVFAVFPQEINALRYPFVALCASWEKIGFYLSALTRYFETLISLTAVFCMLPKQNRFTMGK